MNETLTDCLSLETIQKKKNLPLSYLALQRRKEISHCPHEQDTVKDKK